MNRRYSPTFFLFARPSMVAGAASLLDFGNHLFEYNQSNSPEQADYLALKADLMALSEDFAAVFDATPLEEAERLLTA